MIRNTSITAHSGCDNTNQNTINYLMQALSRPFDYVEVDVRKNPNGVLVLSHNPELTGFEVTLEAAFKLLVNFDKKINLDLKEYNLEDDIIKLAKKIGVELNRIVFTGSITEPCSFLSKYKKTDVFVNPEELIKDFYSHVTRESEARMLELAHEFGFKTVNVNYQMCDDEFLLMCKEKNLTISAWTVDDKVIFDELVNKGILNITTNHSEFIQ